MESSISHSKSFRFILFLIAFFALLALYFHQRCFEDLLFWIKLLISSIPGLILVLITSLFYRGKTRRKIPRWLASIVSFILPSITTYVWIGQKISTSIDAVNVCMYNSFLIILFIVTLLLAIIPKK